MSPETGGLKSDQRFRKGFLLLLVIGITIAFLYVINDFLLTLFVAAIFSGLAHPVYRRITAALGGRTVAGAVLTLVLIVLLIGGPLVAVVTVVTGEAVRITEDVKPWLTSIVNEPSRLDAYIERLPGIERLMPYREQILAKVGEAVGSLGSGVVASVSGLTRNTLASIVNFFMMLYAMFFFLIDGGSYLKALVRYLPLRESEHEEMRERFVSVTRATLKGTLFIGLIQGTLGAVIFAILGISGAVLWGVVMTVLSVVPVVGGALVWVPAAIILAFQGAWFKAVVLVVFCSLVIGSIDNLLRPWLVGQDARMSDLMILFSTLGGIGVFGAMGFIIGPIVAALFMTVWEIFGRAYSTELDVEPSVYIDTHR